PGDTAHFLRRDHRVDIFPGIFDDGRGKRGFLRGGPGGLYLQFRFGEGLRQKEDFLFLLFFGNGENGRRPPGEILRGKRAAEKRALSGGEAEGREREQRRLVLDADRGRTEAPGG